MGQLTINGYVQQLFVSLPEGKRVEKWDLCAKRETEGIVPGKNGD